MKNILLLHGKPTRERYENPEIPKPHKANWFAWVRHELERDGYATVGTPVFPEPDSPNYEVWKEVFDRYDIDSRTSIVGHSAGAEFALRIMSERTAMRLSQLVLVAPWSDVNGKYGNFSKYEINPTIARRIGRITIFNSLDDSKSIQDNVDRLRNILPEAHYEEFTNYGHFMVGNNMETVAFPELIDVLKQEQG
jgi:predicted alpha/beta hydrolase family esterase